jgi:hypothetical protein
MMNLHVRINDEDISEEVESIQISDTFVRLHLREGFDPGRIDEVFYPLYAGDTVFYVVITESNVDPQDENWTRLHLFFGRAYLRSYWPKGGKRGDLSEYETLTMERRS